jgi:hypothetical protein
VRACQFDETVSQIFPLQQDEDDENRGDAGGGERAKQRRDQRRYALERGRRRLATSIGIGLASGPLQEFELESRHLHGYPSVC